MKKFISIVFLFIVSLGTLCADNFSKDKENLFDWTGDFVIDAADLLSVEEERTLKNFLTNLNDTTGIQIAVLTVSTTDAENIHDYAVRHFEKWELGQKDIDNGALLTVSKDDRRMDITTGDGTEGILTDILCKRIIDDVMTPAFKSGDYGKGITDAVNCMAGIITKDDSLTGKLTATEVQSKSKNDEYVDFKYGLLIIAIIALVIIVILILGKQIEKKENAEIERRYQINLAKRKKEEEEKEIKRQEREKAWKALSPAQRKRIQRKQKKNKGSSHKTRYRENDDSYSRASGLYSSRSSSSGSSGSSYRSGGGGRTSGGGASGSW